MGNCINLIRPNKKHNNYEFINNYDGDTFQAIINGNKKKCRLAFIDCAEMRDERKEYKAKAIEAKQFTEAFLKNECKLVEINGIPNKELKCLDQMYQFNEKLRVSKKRNNDKWGRSLVVVFSGHRCLNAELIENKLAIYYEGEGSKFII